MLILPSAGCVSPALEITRSSVLAGLNSGPSDSLVCHGTHQTSSAPGDSPGAAALSSAEPQVQSAQGLLRVITRQAEMT